MLKKIDYNITGRRNSNRPWYNSALIWLQENEPVNNFGFIPFEQTSLKKLPSDIQDKIEKEVLINKIQDNLNLISKLGNLRLNNDIEIISNIIKMINLHESTLYYITELRKISSPKENLTIDNKFNMKLYKDSRKKIEDICESNGLLNEDNNEYDLFSQKNGMLKIKKILEEKLEEFEPENQFGAIIPNNEETPSYLDTLPPELLQKIQESVSAYDIQSFYRKRLKTKSYLLSLLVYYWEVYDTTQNYGGYMQIKPWLVLDPLEGYTAHWLFLASDILNAEDFLKGNFWYNCILHVVSEFIRFDPDNTHYDGEVRRNITVSEDNIEFIIEKMGGMFDFNEHQWYNRAYYWLTQEYKTENAFGKSKVPDNVKNKALYQRIKNKIRKEVDKKGRRWGAYDSGRLVREYKEKGGKYSGSKNKKEKSDLSRWYKEKWVDACSWPKRKSCGRTKSKEKIAYCRPSKKVDSKTPKLIQDLSKTQIKSRCAKKKKNPKKIIK